ncbi:MAG: LapA family protein [Nitrospirota bacterium]
MITIVFVLIIITVVTIFSVQNATPVMVSFLFWRFEASLAIVIFLSALIGLLTGIAIASMIGLKRFMKKQKDLETKRVDIP